jgi:uncharacterized coiled-coil protein SlyX
VADQTKTSTLEELHRAVQDKERELTELDLMLADYHTERSRLIRELRRLRAQLRDAEETASASSAPEP